jgi:hypothetical protein
MFPITSGEAARLLQVTEPRLNRLIRDGKLDPPPRRVGDRRQWDRPHVLQAAELLGLDVAVVGMTIDRGGEAQGATSV